MHPRGALGFVAIMLTSVAFGEGDARTILPDTAVFVPAAPPVGDSISSRENERLVASALALFLGPFGAHRLYFGTTAKVPIIYGITFGGFGILAVLDLGHILFTRDLTRYHDCDRVFMWGQGRRATTPP